MNSHEFLKKNYYKEFLERQAPFANSDLSSDKQEIQKEKFQVISKLVSELFSARNDKEAYNAISGLIVLYLNSFDENYPMDVFSTDEEKPPQETKQELQQILQEEINVSLNEFKNIMTMGKSFMDVLNRFSNQYEVVTNVIYRPEEKKNRNNIPN